MTGSGLKVCERAALMLSKIFPAARFSPCMGSGLAGGVVAVGSCASFISAGTILRSCKGAGRSRAHANEAGGSKSVPAVHSCAGTALLAIHARTYRKQLVVELQGLVRLLSQLLLQNSYLQCQMWQETQ